MTRKPRAWPVVLAAGMGVAILLALGVWQLDRLRVLGCPILLYAARKPEPLARIMMASAVLHARADYVRTHTPEMIRRLLGIVS